MITVGLLAGCDFGKRAKTNGNGWPSDGLVAKQ